MCLKAVMAVQCATCGICDLSHIDLRDLRRCPVCQNYVCLSMQSGPRSVCGGCVRANLNNLERVFVNGKDDRGRWIDPGTLRGIPTCRHCGEPELGMRCGPVIGCFHTPGTSGPGVRRYRMVDGRFEKCS